LILYIILFLTTIHIWHRTTSVCLFFIEDDGRKHLFKIVYFPKLSSITFRSLFLIKAHLRLYLVHFFQNTFCFLFFKFLIFLFPVVLFPFFPSQAPYGHPPLFPQSSHATLAKVAMADVKVDPIF